MASDPTRRTDNWDVKYNTEIIKTVLDTRRPKMKERFGAVTPGLVSMEAQVKAILDLSDVSIIQYPFFLSFARELWRLQTMQEMSGDSLAKEAATLIAKWVSRGLAQAVCETIRSQIFSVGAPTP